MYLNIFYLVSKGVTFHSTTVVFSYTICTVTWPHNVNTFSASAVCHPWRFPVLYSRWRWEEEEVTKCLWLQTARPRQLPLVRPRSRPGRLTTAMRRDWTYFYIYFLAWRQTLGLCVPSPASIPALTFLKSLMTSSPTCARRTMTLLL